MRGTHHWEPVSEHLWRTKYQWCEPGHVREPSIEASWDRVALAVSGVEKNHRDDWRTRFRAILNDLRFLPGGRILANAGTARHATLCNCFAMGPIEDSVNGIFSALRETALTLQAGGGAGLDFSTLRPAGSVAAASGGVASGPVTFMQVWEQASAVLETGNARRGAMMATLRCDHPDIESFVQAKLEGAGLAHFNLSVALTDDFMRALASGGPWPLVFPLGRRPVPAGAEICERIWPGSDAPQPCLVHRRIPARLLWDRIVEAEHASAEPGVLFIDRINQANNLWYHESIATTNPCGEVPLPPYGACCLGSINLPRFVLQPFGEHPEPDFKALMATAAIATRFLDDVVDLSSFPLKAQERSARASRRIGLGITGLADMFLMLGLRYGSPASIELTGRILAAVRDTAYRVSVDIAREKGAFPAFDPVKHGAGPFVLGLSHELQDAIGQHGLRNSHLLSVAPAGSISLLAGNVSSGIEPVFAYTARRSVRGADGVPVAFAVRDAAWRQYREMHGAQAPLPQHFVACADVDAQDQLRVAAAVQACVDNAVSKTVRLAQDATPHAVGLALLQAWELGLKGCAVLRDGSRHGQRVITPSPA